MTPSWANNSTLTGGLLRASRVHDPGARFASGKAFAAAFPGGSWDRRAGESQISRWETGVHQAPLDVVHRYEELLGLPRGQLTAALNTLGRYRSSGRDGRSALRAAPGADPETTRARLADLLDRVDCDGDLTGADWDELTRLLTDGPEWTVAPRRIWRSLAERLTTEMIVSDGVAWQLRFESLNRLMNHRDGQWAAIGACADLAGDAANPVLIEVVSMFDATAAPEAAAQVLRQLQRPANEHALYGAVLACVRKVRHRHFNPDDLVRVVAALRDPAHDPGAPARVRSLARQVLGQMSGQMSGRLPPETPRPGPDGRLVDPGAYAGTTLGRRAVAALHDATDEVFLDMAAAMFDSTVSDMRLYPAMYLKASPFRPALARETAATVAASLTGDPATAVTGLEALRVIGGAEERALVERLLLAPGVPAPVVGQAAGAIAHVGGTSPTSFWRAALRANAARDTVVTGLVYALGIVGEDHLLGEVRDNPGVHHGARRAAAWWLGLPARTRARSRL